MKKSVITIPLLLIASIATIFLGRQHAASQRAEMTEMHLKPEVEERIDEDTPQEDTDNSLSKVEKYESQENLSLYEKIDYLSLVNDDAVIGFYGDIDMQEVWVQSLLESIQENSENSIAVEDFTYPGLDSYELMVNQTSQSVLDNQPDILFYGLPALPDKTRDIGLADTDEYMSSVLNQLTQNESMEIIFIEPYVQLNEINQPNSRSLDYRSYLNTMRDIIEERQLTLLPLHADFSEEAEKNGLSYFYTESESELNEAGNKLASELVDNYFSKINE